MSKSPDFIEPFVGWKGLRADDEGNLWSPSLETLWPTGEPLMATCTRNEHTPPITSCSCGIYAVNSFEDLRERRYNWGEAADGRIWVVAEVSLWGRLRPGQIGYRAQFAYPETVYVPGHKLRLGARIGERYGVPIRVIDRFTGRRM